MAKNTLKTSIKNLVKIPNCFICLKQPAEYLADVEEVSSYFPICENCLISITLKKGDIKGQKIGSVGINMETHNYSFDWKNDVDGKEERHFIRKELKELRIIE